jgi:hypothetical protein
LKSFGLFTAFMERTDAMQRLGECHSYIIDTYIDIIWMEKKEKLLMYNRLTKMHFDQCTSCTSEHENSFMKWGEMVVNPQQHLHQTVHKINKKSNSKFIVKESHDAKKMDATHIWSITKKRSLYRNVLRG